jgi:hypothetical protein
METGLGRRAPSVIAAACGLLALCVSVRSVSNGQDTIDRNRVKELYERSRRGDTLTPEDQKYLDRALRALKAKGNPRPESPRAAPGRWEKTIYVGPVKQLLEERREQQAVGYKPLTEMSAADKHFGEDGGLYGGGRNEPPAAHQRAAQEALKQVTPLDRRGRPSEGGKVVFVCLGMSNTGAVFFRFQEKVDRDPAKPAHLVLVNCCWSAGASSWATDGGTWTRALDRLKQAGVAPEQVQVAWVKHAEPFPEPEKNRLGHARLLHANLMTGLQLAKKKFPNLRVAYLSSRTYGGYAVNGVRLVNPEPFAYESAFAVRWTIQEQVKGGPALNYDAKKGAVAAPVLLWGPYLWADGATPRKDGLTWKRSDYFKDGLHPDASGQQKAVEQMIRFFKNDPNARSWFVGR